MSAQVIALLSSLCGLIGCGALLYALYLMIFGD